MSEATCASVRELLTRASAGGGLEGSPALWSELQGRGAVEGDPAAPKITAIGRHVLKELDLRAYRYDPLPLDALAQELDRNLSDLDSIARTAEYFLGELGPITPREALPYLRIVSIGLANRRETPEELAERFRNVWGMLEVMGGDPRDRLLGAELLVSASAEMDRLYAPMMQTVERLRAARASRAVAAAAILELSGTSSEADIARWRDERRSFPTDGAAALGAAIDADAERRALRARVAAAWPAPAPPESALATIFLSAVGADPAEVIPRASATAALLGKRFRRPLLASALLAAEHRLSPEELVDWLDKSVEIARRRKLAPAAGELDVLALGLVEGLPRTAFNGRGAGPHGAPLAELATLLALHAWLYRPVIDPAFEAELAPAPGPRATPAAGKPTSSRP